MRGVQKLTYPELVVAHECEPYCRSVFVLFFHFGRSPFGSSFSYADF